MTRAVGIAVIGATGLVGETLIQVLEERDFPVAELFALASDRSLGTTVRFRDRTLAVQDLAAFDFSRADLALFCAGEAVSREYAPRAAQCGCTVIDNTSAFRDQEDIPLVVPEVNLHTLCAYRQRGIVASPSCSAVHLVVALKPLHDAAGIERINVATYESVSGAGRQGVDELAEQSIALLSGKGPVAPRTFAKQIAFNCLPQIDRFEAGGFTRAEMDLIRDTRRILEAPALRVNVTAVRVPVFYGDSAAVTVQTRLPLGPAAARELLQKAPGVTVFDEPRDGGYPAAATEAANRDTVYVGRIREDPSSDRGLNLWIVADNVRKGAAVNSIQIAEALVRQPI